MPVFKRRELIPIIQTIIVTKGNNLTLAERNMLFNACCYASVSTNEIIKCFIRKHMDLFEPYLPLLAQQQQQQQGQVNYFMHLASMIECKKLLEEMAAEMAANEAIQSATSKAKTAEK